MSKRFAVFDIDGTLIRWQLYHAIADTMVRLGYADAKIYSHVKLARMAWKRREDTDAFRTYEAQLVKAYEQVLASLTYEQFQTAAQNVFEEYKDQVYIFTRDLIRDLKTKGYLLFAISGSQIEIVKMIADYYGFDDCIGTTYEHNETGFTGKVTTHKESKHIILEQLVKNHGATYKAVANPIAMNPTGKLFEVAKDKGWTIVVERKNVIYKLEPKDGSYLLVKAD